MASLDVISLHISIPYDIAIKSVVEACLDSKTEFPISISALEELIFYLPYNNCSLFNSVFCSQHKGTPMRVLFVCQSCRNLHAEN